MIRKRRWWWNFISLLHEHFSLRWNVQAQKMCMCVCHVCVSNEIFPHVFIMRQNLNVCTSFSMFLTLPEVFVMLTSCTSLITCEVRKKNMLRESDGRGKGAGGNGTTWGYAKSIDTFLSILLTILIDNRYLFLDTSLVWIPLVSISESTHMITVHRMLFTCETRTNH